MIQINFALQGISNRAVGFTSKILGLLQIIRPESITRPNIGTLVPRHKPALALLGCAVGKGVWHWPAPCVALQCIIANLFGRIHRLGNIAPLKGPKPFLGIARPDAGITIGLQFNPHRNTIAVCCA